MNREEVKAKNRKTVEKIWEDTLGLIYPIEELYAPNAKFYQPFFFPGKVSYINQQGAESKYLCHEDTCVIFKDWVFGETQYIDTEDPNIVIALNDGHGYVMREDGKYYTYENSYIHIFKMKDGLITEYYEYTNPLGLMDAFGIEHPNLPTPEETNEKYAKLNII